MADIQWTEDQRRVINSRNRDLLVSAAAGSGKTAVLVEHILSMVREGTDVDQLLVVTFTVAAASEMKKKLQDALTREVEKDPDNSHLRRQLKLIHSAQISTIDSFCNYIVKNHFSSIDLDPAFRIGDEAELSLLKQDVLDDLLEEEYDQGTAEFLNFTEVCSSGTGDKAVEDKILKLYRFSEANVYPEKWLQECLIPYETSPEGEAAREKWLQGYVESLRLQIQGTAAALYDLEQSCKKQYPDWRGTGKIAENREALQEILKQEEYDDFCQALKSFDPGIFPRKSNSDGIEQEKAEQIKNLRKSQIERVKELKKKVCPREAILADLAYSGPAVRELVRLTSVFGTRYQEAKKKRGLAEFNDIEHDAVHILRDPEGKRTDVAKELSLQYQEILIDEYQDSSDLQEAILTAVSQEEDGHPNIFMVGDKKQSIYRFRMARPELFVGKFSSYTEEVSSHQRMVLHENFRSRKEVLESANEVFGQLMHETVGGVDYTEAEALHPAAHFEASGDKKTGGRTELLVLNLSEMPEEGEDLAKEELEARMVAGEILKITEANTGLFVWDGKEKAYRLARLSDIAVLSRSTGQNETYRRVLESMGIPVEMENKEGYYHTFEVSFILDLLSVIDNPFNDIPLAAVMTGPVYDFTEAELAEIRIETRQAQGALYESLLYYKGRLKDRIDSFLNTIIEYRKQAAYRSISQLLRAVYEETGFLAYASGMPGGEKRAANLKMLADRAEDFEKTSYRGIFNFLRYIDKCKEGKIETGEAQAEDSQGNAVTLMTIHKSKGLEFPVVFVVNCGQQINDRDASDSFLLHDKLGISARPVDLERRVKKNSMMHNAFATRIKEESRGEELRILYVAMTRAKEKLFLTGCTKEKDAFMKPDHVASLGPAAAYETVMGGASYLSWLMKVAWDCPSMAIREVLPEDILAGEEEVSRKHESVKQVFEEAVRDILDGAKEPRQKRQVEELEEILNYPYQYNTLYRVPATTSVSKLKAEWLAEKEGEAPVESPVDDKTPLDLSEKDEQNAGEKAGKITGSRLGTLYHAAFEHLKEGLPAGDQLDRMEKEGIFTSEERRALREEVVNNFLATDLATRFFAAEKDGKGFRERRFIVGFPVKEVYPEAELARAEEELLMVQGTIDMYFEEPEGLILVDYKTDYVRQPEELRERYKIQLDLYEKALTAITGKKVLEKWIYSTRLNQEIRL